MIDDVHGRLTTSPSFALNVNIVCFPSAMKFQVLKSISPTKPLFCASLLLSTFLHSNLRTNAGAAIAHHALHSRIPPSITNLIYLSLKISTSRGHKIKTFRFSVHVVNAFHFSPPRAQALKSKVFIAVPDAPNACHVISLPQLCLSSTYTRK